LPAVAPFPLHFDDLRQFSHAVLESPPR
jgi:hypothetical protein